ncbi:MAG TPA: RNA polymerase sigma factor [Xanthobacteraceae bacterium]|nr:RNA polymerase sigma factor [Xanthobacteraceae bacterium]
MRDGEIERIFRDEAGRVLATLIRLVGDFELAEEAMQDAFAAALEQWTALPANPRAWLVNVGRNKAIDRIRRQIRLRAKRRYIEAEAIVASQALPPAADEDAFGDDMLRLIFTCCHPALSMETRVALTLRAICGLTTEAVARAFLVNEETMAQRLVRAKRKIRGAGIPYATPSADMLDERLDGVLAVIYLVFSEGYAGTSGAALMREDLAREAIRLGRLLEELLPGRSAIAGLLALMLLHDARRAARATADGDIILLDDQDRSQWDQAQIADGLALVERALRAPERPSVYTVQAAISALHARARHHQDTDWPQIVGLYEVLVRLQPSPVVELNHAAAVSMVDGPARALDLIDALTARGDLAGYHLLPSVRANLLNRLGRREEARAAYQEALVLAKLDPERRLIVKRLAELE